MEIRHTSSGDLDTVMAIYDHARQYMRDHGNHNQWINGYPSKELISEDINENRSYVCVDEGQIVGAFCFTIGIDPTYIKIYEGEWLDDEPYGVVHRIASANHKKGVASYCLDWCLAQCANIRIDTHEDNTVMQKFLLKNGYLRCGIIYLESGAPRVAFQRNNRLRMGNMTNTITTIVLDIGNVLAHFRWREYLEECGYNQEVRERIAKATVLSGFWNEWDRGEREEDELIAESIAKDPGVKDEILSFFHSFDKIVKEYPYSRNFVKGLKDNGYKIYLLSNYSKKHFTLSRPTFEFINYVDGGVISYEVKSIKPEPMIYQELIDKYNINPSEAVFLDDLADNLEGAKPFGFHTIQVKNYDQTIAELREMGVRI